MAGKTGTTNEEKDAWFIGYTPDVVVGVYIGYDKPRHLARGATGGHLAAPIVKDFLKAALADKPGVPFRVPPGIKLIRVDPKTGMRAGPGTERAILEAFKPGTAPPDSYSVVGYGSGENSGENAGASGARASRPTPTARCARVRAGCIERRICGIFLTRDLVRRPFHSSGHAVAPVRRRRYIPSTESIRRSAALEVNDARGNPEPRRRDQAVGATAEEASLTSIPRRAASPN